MTQEEKNIKLAELDGWKEIEIVPYREYHLKTYWNVAIGRPPKSISNTIPIPNYFTDLNAVHELEKVIKKDFYLWKAYESFLARIVLGDCGMFHITAAQRCEAIGKTLNLW
jgi:hypothetical protein